MKSLGTALRVLKRLGEFDEPRGVAEIADGLGLGRSQCSKLLGTMREAGLISQDARTRKYQIGIGAYAIGCRYIRNEPLAQEALPVMRALVRDFGFSVTLSRMFDDAVLHIQVVEGPALLERPMRVGSRSPYHANSAGRVLLSRRPPDELLALFARKPPARFTDRTITDPEELLAAFARAGRLGAAFTVGETVGGAGALAAPIISPTQTVAGSLALVCPPHQSEECVRPNVLAALHNAARIISIRLGADAYPYGDPNVASSTAQNEAICAVLLGRSSRLDAP